MKNIFFLIKNKQYNISYIIPPTKKQHQDFCINHPYRFWFLVYEDKKLHGSIYITYENSIGINFLDLKNKNNIAIESWGPTRPLATKAASRRVDIVIVNE